MFTGIVEAVQPVTQIAQAPGGRRIAIDLGQLAEDAHLGDSICVDGVCLTISALTGTVATFDVMAETVRVSTLAQLRARTRVNLERALAANGRFGGHIVQGHVDGVGYVDQIEQDPSKHVLWIRCQPDLMAVMIPKGSVAISGVSLTIVGVEEERFSVWLIPTTLRETNLGELEPGRPVNLEADIISKWICRKLDALAGGKPSSLTLDKLREHGFA